MVEITAADWLFEVALNKMTYGKRGEILQCLHFFGFPTIDDLPPLILCTGLLVLVSTACNLNQRSYRDSSDYSDSDSDGGDEDEALRAMRATQRAKALRAKFEEWEQSADAKEQERQIQLTDENGYSLDTASHLKKRFEALQLREQMEREAEAAKEAAHAGGSGRETTTFRPKRFKVSLA